MPPATPSDLGQDTGDTFADLQQDLATSMRNLRALNDPANQPQAPIAPVLPPPPKVEQYNPMQAWGSAAMIIAGLGSLLTRRSMTTALNSAATVMTAYKQGDSDAAASAMGTWKAETTNALNQQKFELTQYTDALKAHADNVRDQTAAVTAVATALKDETVLKLISSQGVGAVAPFLFGRAKAAGTAAAEAAESQKVNDQQTQWEQYLQQHPKPADQTKVPQWSSDSRAAAHKIFGAQNPAGANTTDPDDIRGPTGYSMNEMKTLAQGQLNGDPRPNFGGGKSAVALDRQYNQAMAALEKGQQQPTPGQGPGTNPDPNSVLGQLRASDPNAYSIAQMIANYQMQPIIGYQLSKPWGQKVMAMVQQIAQANGTEYDATEYKTKSDARDRFHSGPLGNPVRSFNVLVQHLDVLRQLNTALANNDMTTVNQASNFLTTKFGSPQVTNFNAAKRLVADEIIKAVTGAAGALGDRDDAASQIDAAQSPAQLAGVVETYQRLAAGQLDSLGLQYKAATGLDDFDSMLSPETEAIIQKIQPILPANTPTAAAAPAAATPSNTGGSVNGVTWSVH
jgi:hypothetical protein